MSSPGFSILHRDAALLVIDAAVDQLIALGAPSHLAYRLRAELEGKPLADASVFTSDRTLSIAVLRSGLDPVLTGLILRESRDGQTWTAKRFARFETPISNAL